MSQPIGAWLTRKEDGIVARRGDRVLRQQAWRQQILALGHQLLCCSAQRWALCFEDSYLFSVALLAALHAGDRRSLS